jgi:phosphoenolpyruvate carboxykinase (ATP)
MKMRKTFSRENELPEHGIRNPGTIEWNLTPANLVEKALSRGEAMLASNGSLAVLTGQITGRSPNDKFIVKDENTGPNVNWGTVNRAMTEERFDRLLAKVQAYVQGRDLFVQDLFGGADPQYGLPFRIVTETAWHNLFGRHLLVRPQPGTASEHGPALTIYFVPGLQADPVDDGTWSETCIAVNFTRGIVLILGTQYAGELKKSVFTYLNYVLPDRGVLPMHCSANTDDTGNVALFFGLSGTGKTTLSADPNRRLIGDDEHGWSDEGVFNFEGGCYAECIRLSRENEPQIWKALRFGAVLENVVIGEDRVPDYDSDAITENTRAAYPVDFIENAVIPGIGGHPKTLLFLPADAFGVLPPIARLTPEMAMYHFLSGYTSKPTGTERGLGKEPQPSFSACFGEPFLPRRPAEYAKMLGHRMRRHDVSCWLVNTGWVGGPSGVGERISLRHTRAMVNAAIQGALQDEATNPHPQFQILVPQSCPGVSKKLLDPRGMWADPASYDLAASDLSAKFQKNFEKFKNIDQEILKAAPAGS